MRSQISDFHGTTWSDTGLVTFALDQTYSMNGQKRTLSAPTSMLFRQRNDEWKIAMIHSVPIPELMLP